MKADCFHSKKKRNIHHYILSPDLMLGMEPGGGLWCPGADYFIKFQTR